MKLNSILVWSIKKEVNLLTKRSRCVGGVQGVLCSPSRKYFSVKSQNRETVTSSEFENSSSSSSSDDDERSSRDDNQDKDKNLSWEQEFKTKHFVPLTPLQKAMIYAGSGIAAFLDPTKAENIATFGEISATPVLSNLYTKMMQDPEACRILTQKPRINSKTVDLQWLSTLPEDTLGGTYFRFLERNKVTPDSRLPVRFIKDPELAYVMQRYREIHDLVHTVSGQPTNMLGEVLVKWIEGIQTGLPMCLTGGLFGATRLYPKQRIKYSNTHLKWALEVGFNSKPFLNIFYEERWEQPILELRRHISPLLLTPPKS